MNSGFLLQIECADKGKQLQRDEVLNLEDNVFLMTKYSVSMMFVSPNDVPLSNTSALQWKSVLPLQLDYAIKPRTVQSSL